ncbi:MAG: phosphopantetheine-binding protein [Rhodobacteraceae bacterium]|nr:MAG: phosphopantetheine-binding protein [Paracoccaceae bacterium]
MSVQDKIIAIVAEQAFLEPSDITVASRLDDLGVDSMGLVECIFAIEEAFDIQIPFNANDPAASEFDISTVKTIVTAVEGLISAQKNA